MTVPTDPGMPARLHRAVGVLTGMAVGEAIQQEIETGTSPEVALDLRILGSPARWHLGPAALMALGGAHALADGPDDDRSGAGALLGMAVVRGLAGSGAEDIVASLEEVAADRGSPGGGAGTGGGTWRRDLDQAIACVATGGEFPEVIRRAVAASAPRSNVIAMAGALGGMQFGAQAIPSLWTSYLRGMVDGREVLVDDLQDLGAELVGFRLPPPDPPLDPVGPHRTTSGLWVSNRSGALAAPSSYAVISLCRVGTLLDHHPHRRAPLLIDNWADWNPGGRGVVLEVLEAIHAFQQAGLEVLVHCAYGASRTGLILRAWNCRTFGIDPESATTMAQEEWWPTHLRNPYFTDLLHDLYADGLLSAPSGSTLESGPLPRPTPGSGSGRK